MYLNNKAKPLKFTLRIKTKKCSFINGFKIKSVTYWQMRRDRIRLPVRQLKKIKQNGANGVSRVGRLLMNDSPYIRGACTRLHLLCNCVPTMGRYLFINAIILIIINYWWIADDCGYGSCLILFIQEYQHPLNYYFVAY